MTLFRRKAKHLQTGDAAEQRALAHLEHQGLSLVERNFRCKLGELDLVMRDGEALVIVEVRFRKSEHFGGALASVTPQKQARIVAATQHYVIIKRLNALAVRFDVVALAGDGQIQWIKNAFQT
ncbi:MAG: YraN family protein [Methylomonas sp.]|nr:YraN family protein [Methylomonas sp.]PPD22225.1 MAG: YraN family protein [Methylomonas sp.]PPD27761.1 MAG: YraN family protein [Methylomonas sp.]PPD39771.1 MAG: YraN family protein [Methylomonas sp.]PPD42545.1 MAG: YraN family protein [Methylomonas sp.]